MKTKAIVVLGLLALALTVIAGESGSLGIVLLEKKAADQPMMTGTIWPDSPAGRAGIKSGWFLISVDGTNVVGMSPDQTMSYLRGPIGESVTIEFADSKMSQTNKLTIKRGKIVAYSPEKVQIIDQ